MVLKFKLSYTIFSLILLISLLLSCTYFLNASASSDSNDIVQIPSEPTDFPENNQETLEVLFSKATSNSDSFNVIGSIKNTGENTLRHVDVTAHFLDENNQTVGVTTCCYADPTDIEPGHTSSFDSFSFLEDMAGDPRYYRLSFNWQVGYSESGNNRPATEHNASCESITKDFTLTSNMDCSTNGLSIINQKDLTIDLNGYNISGPGKDIQNSGIRVDNSSNIMIRGPGTIKDFQTGVLNTMGEGIHISRVTSTENENGIYDIESRNTKIEGNLVFANKFGVTLDAVSSSILLTNLLKSNNQIGVSLINSVDNEISKNTIAGSTTGVFLNENSRENDINSNNILQNGRVDINNNNGLSAQTNNNVFFYNNCNVSVPDGLCLAP